MLLILDLKRTRLESVSSKLIVFFKSTSETEVNSKKFQRQSDNAVVGEGDSIYDSRPDNLQYNELDKDCLYLQP